MPSLRTFWKQVVYPRINTTILMIGSGIVGNRADAILLWITSTMIGTITISVWVATTIWVCTTLVAVFFILISLKRGNSWRDDLVSTVDLARLGIKGNQDKSKFLQQGMNALARVSYRFFDGQVVRMSILIPDQTKQYLVPLYSFNIDQDSIVKAKFYIGNNPDHKKERGLAGWTYLDGNARAIYIEMDHEGNITACDKNGAIEDKYKNTHIEGYPPYKALIVVPLPETSKNRIGVVCLDSLDVSAFRSQREMDFLEEFSNQVINLMMYYRIKTGQINPTTSGVIPIHSI